MGGIVASLIKEPRKQITLGQVGMLHDFLTSNRTTLIERCRAKAVQWSSPEPINEEFAHGIPRFIDQIIRQCKWWRRHVEANQGSVRGRDISGAGCVFTIDLPRYSLA